MTYTISTPTGTIRATASTYSEALRISDAYTKADRILHTVHTSQEA